MSTVESPADSTVAPNPLETCPRCHTTESWGQSSWCPNCNYYPVVDSGSIEGESWADDLPEVPQETVDDRTALESIPVWFWGLLAGVVGIAVFSVSVRLSFPEEDGPRGMIALVQLSLGLLTMLTAHGLAAKLAFSTDRRTNFNDVLLSWFSVWQPTIGRLPKTHKRIWAVVWGAVAFLTAVTIIGGIDYSAPFRTHKAPDIKPMNIIGKVAGAARAGAANGKEQSMDEAFGSLASEVADAEDAMGGVDAGPPKSLGDALSEVGDMDDKLKNMKGSLDADGVDSLEDAQAKDKEELEPEANRELECFIYGVVVDEKNIPVSFLFAANTKGEDQHVAEVKAADMPKAKFRNIAVRLYKEVARHPSVPSERKAVWVKPVVTCRLKFQKFTEEGELHGAEFDEIVVNQRGSFDASSNQLKGYRQR